MGISFGHGPKKAPGEYRLIHHLSYPEGSSVNDAIPEHLCSVRYMSFDSTVHMVRGCGFGVELGKCNIKLAFRLLPVHPGDFELLGFSFQGLYYVDRALPMGCSVTCLVFERFSTFLEWALKFCCGHESIVHYLDDFLVAGPNGSAVCAQLMEGFAHLAKELEVPLAEDKNEGPAQRLTFLGIELDTVAMTSRLPCGSGASLFGKAQGFIEEASVFGGSP